MATIERVKEPTNRQRVALLVLGLLVVAVIMFVIVSRNRPPQMGVDREVFTTVDALFTAVTARDAKLLDQCARRLEAHKQAEKLPAEAAEYLEGVIREARADEWQSGAERLYVFMKAQQRREGKGKEE